MMNLYKPGDKFALNGRMYRVTAIDDRALCIWAVGKTSCWLTDEQLDALYATTGAFEPGDILARADGLQLTILDSTPFLYSARVFGQELLMSIEQITNWHLSEYAVEAMRARLQAALDAACITAEITLNDADATLKLAQPVNGMLVNLRARLSQQGISAARLQPEHDDTLVVDYPVSWVMAALMTAAPVEPDAARDATAACPPAESQADPAQPVAPADVQRVLTGLSDAFRSKRNPETVAIPAPPPAVDGVQQMLQMRVAELEAENAALIEELADRISAEVAPTPPTARQHAIVPNCSAAELDRRHHDGWTVQHMQFCDGNLHVVYYRMEQPARMPAAPSISIQAVGPQISLKPAPRVAERVAQRMAAADARVVKAVLNAAS